MWHPLPAAGPHGVDPVIVRGARTLGFRAAVPRALAGLDVELDAAELAASGSAVRVGGEGRPIGPSGRTRLCSPCRAGDTLAVEIDPGGGWWNPPRLIVPDAGWEEISEGTRWARYFLGDDAIAEVPGPEVARALLAASAQPDKAHYRALVAGWMERLDPAAREIRADTIDVVGNAHIDAAWLWRWDETVDVVRNTWRTAVKLLEKYPGTTFAASAAAYYEWLEEYEPDLLRDIQRLTREGRWAPVGGWWVEADANLPSGEALVRQALYGQRTYERLFGTTARVAWIPDTFGYAWTLPQIFRKAGLEYFVTQKLRWNDTDAWRADRNLFWWEGRDGTRILTYVPYGYTHQLQARTLADEWKASRDSTATRRMLVLYGVGDHGGGPTMEMLDRARELARIPTFPPLRGVLPAQSLGRMQAGAGDAPVIDDELYLEYHRGVFTSQAAMKMWNRRMEGLLDAAEAAAAHASFVALPDAWYNYPRGALTAAWTTTLFNQFHDLLPGSGIGAIYTDAASAYRDAERIGRHGARPGGRDDRRDAGHAPARRRRRTVPGAESLGSRSGRRGGDPLDGRRGHGHGREGAGASLRRPGRTRCACAWPTSRQPAVGWFSWRRGEPAPRHARPARRARARRPRQRAPARGGRPHHRRDLADRRPGLRTGRPAGRRRRESAGHARGSPPRVGRLEHRRHGRPVGGRSPIRCWWESRRATRWAPPWRSSAPARTAASCSGSTLPDGERRLAVETRALWRADHRLLKASFPLALRFDSVWAEIPYGAIARAAVPRTRADSARYELPMQGWIDASDGTWGVSLVNDAKHGYDVRGDTLRLTLLKSPKWPDPQADMGEHVFRYDLVVHGDDWRSGDTETAADALNAPLRAVAVPVHEGEGRSRSFVQVEGPGVELGALKIAEDEAGALVLRLVERHGSVATATIELPWAFEWRNADLLERPVESVTWAPSEGTRAAIRLAPWEIATVLVRRR